MFTACDLFLRLQEIKVIEAGIGWLLSNFAERWHWYQSKTENQKRALMIMFCGVIGLVSTIAYVMLLCVNMALPDAIANFLYGWGASFVSSHLNYARVKNDKQNAEQGVS